ASRDSKVLRALQKESIIRSFDASMLTREMRTSCLNANYYYDSAKIHWMLLDRWGENHPAKSIEDRISIRCTVNGCACDSFTPGKRQLRCCDKCHHGWVLHDDQALFLFSDSNADHHRVQRRYLPRKYILMPRDISATGREGQNLKYWISWSTAAFSPQGLNL
ncbi:hypothetical protein PV328_002287, partial [Microctonus aethiopoides]